MSANYSFFYNPTFDFSSGNGANSTTCNILSIPMYITRSILVPPLAIIILYMAFQRWKKQSGWTSVSHCDVFTYNLAVMELLGVLGIPFLISGFYTGLKYLDRAGKTIFTIPYSGETFFHILTCMERYLAVAHPHTYIGLRSARGILIRNIIICCVWLLSFLWLVIMYLHYPRIPTAIVSTVMVPSLAIVSFCSLYVLCVLIRPGPGDGGKGKERVDQSKKRAFLTIIAIFAALWLWFTGLLIAFGVDALPFLSDRVKCQVARSVSWFDVPCNLVLPVLYLLREGKFSFLFCKKGNNKPKITN